MALKARNKEKKNKKFRKKARILAKKAKLKKTDSQRGMSVDNADSTKVKGDDSSSGSASSRDEELRINAMKMAIMKEENRRFKLLSKRFKLNKDVDMSMGRCCARYSNESGAKFIHIVDLIFVPNLPRWLFALWAKIDKDRYPMYARMR